MEYIIILLIVIAFIQGILIVRKGKKIHEKEDQDRAQELLNYIEEGKAQFIDEQGRNVLMIAVLTDFSSSQLQLDLVKKALASGLDVNITRGEDRKSVLFDSLVNLNEAQVVQALLQAGAKANALNSFNETSLFPAILGRKSVYDMIVEEIEDLNHRRNDGMTALMVAVSKMNLYVIDDLIKRGADVHALTYKHENLYELSLMALNEQKERHASRLSWTPNYNPGELSAKDKRKRNKDMKAMVKKLEALM